MSSHCSAISSCCDIKTMLPHGLQIHCKLASNLPSWTPGPALKQRRCQTLHAALANAKTGLPSIACAEHGRPFLLATMLSMQPGLDYQQGSYHCDLEAGVCCQAPAGQGSCMAISLFAAMCPLPCSAVGPHCQQQLPCVRRSSELPNFIASTKFFACLDLSESQELLEQARVITVQPNETLFEVRHPWAGIQRLGESLHRKNAQRSRLS